MMGNFMLSAHQVKVGQSQICISSSNVQFLRDIFLLTNVNNLTWYAALFHSVIFLLTYDSIIEDMNS